jgi:Uri superfamily endonuclease
MILVIVMIRKEKIIKWVSREKLFPAGFYFFNGGAGSIKTV